MAKRKLKITPVLLTLNVVVLLIIAGFYTFRLVKYYLKENKTHKGETVTLLADEIIKKQSYMDETKGLVYDEKNNIYRYKGEVNNNYLKYSGMLFRIVAIDNEENIRAISEDNITLLYSGLEKGFKDSYVNKWLNKSEINYSGIFENALYSSDELLADTYMCQDKIDDLSNITCEEYYTDSKITLLSLYDYKEAGGKSSYLNNAKSFNLSTIDSKNENYYITESGDVGLIQKTSRVSEIRPVISIKSNSKLISGDGTLNKPYIIEEHNVKKLNQAYVGDIVKFSNSNYKIVEVNTDKVKVAAVDVLKDNDKNFEISFGGSSSAYNTSKNTIGYYLNNTFLNSLEDKNSIISSDWYIGKLNLGSLDYASVYSSKTNAKIGMLTLGDFYVQDLTNIFTLSRGIEANNIINVINSNAHIYGDTTSSKYNVRVAFYLNGNMEIKSGDGTKESPYELGVNNETKEK